MSYRICQYHGRSCENPGACLNRAPRKYEGDGTLETIDPERLTIGNIVRMTRGGDKLPAFSDNVVIGIKVQHSNKRAMLEKVDHAHFTTLKEAQTYATKDDYILVLARPYMYASNPFASMPNFLVGAEKYEVMGNRIEESHKVVVMSTGEYAKYLSSPLLHKWEVNVSGDLGKVYDDLSESGARAVYKIHRQMAQGAYGRKGGETVTLLCDGEKVEEYAGNMG